MEIPRSDDPDAPGPWWRPARFVGLRSATLRCPECGTVASLHRHAIAEDGAVSPSVVCPTEGCGFHKVVRLRGWSAMPDPP